MRSFHRTVRSTGVSFTVYLTATTDLPTCWHEHSDSDEPIACRQDDAVPSGVRCSASSGTNNATCANCTVDRCEQLSAFRAEFWPLEGRCFKLLPHCASDFVDPGARLRDGESIAEVRQRRSASHTRMSLRRL